MLIKPENIELNKVVKKRTFNFDTNNRMYGNLVFVATDDYDDYNEVFTAKLFKPQQMMSTYTVRKFKPFNRAIVTLVQKEIYADIRKRTNGFLKIGKALLSGYAGRNLAYNMVPEYNATLEKIQMIKQADKGRHDLMQEYFQNFIVEKTELVGYDKSYIIFPITKYIDKFKNIIQVPAGNIYSPLLEFLKSLRHGTYDASKYRNISRIVFYNPFANAMVVMDPSDPELIADFNTYFEKINRLNKFNRKRDVSELEDPLDILNNEEDDDLVVTADEEDEIEDAKDKVKTAVLKNVSKQLKANLTDYDATNNDEKNIISAIDKKVEEYLSKEDKNEKSFNELVDAVKADPEVTRKALAYIETKKIGMVKQKQLVQNLERETEIVSTIEDLEEDVDKFFSPEIINDNVKTIDDRAKKTTLIAMDRYYNDSYAKQDLINNLTFLSDQDYLPATLYNYKEVDTSDDFTFKKTITAQFKTDEGKVLGFKLDIPIIFDNHCIKIKGNIYVIQKQLCRLPIVKTKEDRVEIVTNLNKMTCERAGNKVSRKNTYLKKLLKQYEGNVNFKIVYGFNTQLNASYKNNMEYEEMSGFLSGISDRKYQIILNRPEVEKEFELLSYPDNYNITDAITPVGFAITNPADPEIDKELLYIINATGEMYQAKLLGKTVSKVKVAESLFDFIIEEILHEDPNKSISVGQSYTYSNCKFIAVTYPIFVLAGMTVGIDSLLKRNKTKYRLSQTKLKHDIRWIEVQFKDKWLYYENNIKNTLLLNILYTMNTKDYDYGDFNTEEPYVRYCVDYLGQPPFVRQTVRININKMLDPMTRDILKDLKQPTDIIDLLLMANEMLTNNSYILKNNMTNYRVRGNEVINAIMYELIAVAYRKYQNSRILGSNNHTLKIPQNALIAKLLEQQNINVSSTLNPVLELEAASGASQKGFKGVNLSDAYTTELRAYDSSMNGYLSANATPFSGSVGIQRSLTFNPNISHVRGYITDIEDSTKLDATQRLSVSELLSFTTSTRADAPRAAMQVGQSKHAVPVYTSHRQLMGSGIDKSIPYMLSDNFCFKAKKNGTVESIDEINELAILRYFDDTYDAIDLKESLSKNSNSGFFINQNFLIKYKVGEDFKKGDIIAYTPAFFDGRGSDTVFTQGTLAKIAITSGDFVFEDATYITDKLSEQCATDITMQKSVSLGPNTIVHSIADIGDHVNVNDVLMSFTQSFDDPATAEFLQDLIATLGDEMADEIGTEEILSKYSGRISDIKMYYNVPFETLSLSLQALINGYNQAIENRRRALIRKGVKPAAIKLSPVGEQKEKKIDATEFEGVLISFFVTHKDKLAAGDKLAYGTALKGIVSKVSEDEKAPFSEFRENEEILGAIPASGIPSRMTEDIFPMIYGNKLLIELGRWIHKTWNE